MFARSLASFPRTDAQQRQPDSSFSQLPNALFRSRGMLRAKLAVASTSCPLEAEADHFADAVIASPRSRPSITGTNRQAARKCDGCSDNPQNRQCAACDNEGEQLLTKPTADGPKAAEAPAVVHHALGSPQRSLDPATQTFFQARTGFDFSAVSVHSDQTAWSAAQAIGARAFTVGRHIVFGRGEYDPSSIRGRHLLAHELAHVLQADTGLIHRQSETDKGGFDADGLASEIIALLHSRDPVGGMKTGEAVQKLYGLDWTQLVSVLRAIRARDALDLAIIQEDTTLLISVAAESVLLEATPNPEPETLARYRARVQRLSPQNQAAVQATYPTATSPAEPALPAGGLVPPPGAPTGVPAGLLATLHRSYARRQAGLPGSEKYLANAFWGGRPADFWQALKQMGPALDIVRRVYARWIGVGVPWSFVEAIYAVWSGTSEGFGFVCTDRHAIEDALNASASLCQDTVGGLYHWWAEGSTPCWRETITGSPGIHFCTGGNPTTVHIDAHQVVSGRWPGGYCQYDITGSVIDHFKDLGWW